MYTDTLMDRRGPVTDPEVVFRQFVELQYEKSSHSDRGSESEVAHKWARWLHDPCRLGGPHRFGAGGRIKSGAQVGKVAT